jgi:hypothetical protein
MARSLDEHQQAELSAFVNELAEAAGYTTTAEWARESGYPASNLSELRNGNRSVDGYNLLRLIRAAAARAGSKSGQFAMEKSAGKETLLATIATLDAILGELRDVVAEEELTSSGDGPRVADQRAADADAAAQRAAEAIAPRATETQKAANGQGD